MLFIKDISLLKGEQLTIAEKEAQQEIDVKQNSIKLFEVYQICKRRNHLYDISAAIGDYAEKFG